MQDLAAKIGKRTRLVAVGYASNAVGTINNVAEVVRLARQAGALSYIDAVHYAPHGPIDVRALDCDFLVCSTYKFFGPHMGVLYGKREHLKRLRPYKVRPNTDNIPNCWEWGTLNHECIAGIKACVDYWEELGHRAKPSVTTRRAAILAAHEAIHQHERKMMEKMIAGLLAIPGLKLYGITDPRRFENRCATIVVRIEGHTPLELATKTRRARLLHVGRKLLCPEPHRTVGRRAPGRISAHRAGALQHDGGSGRAARSAAGDCERVVGYGSRLFARRFRLGRFVRMRFV